LTALSALGDVHRIGKVEESISGLVEIIPHGVTIE
jgi:hypothetical protein